MDGYKMEGKPLIVRIAGQKDERPPRRDRDDDRYERRGGDRDRYDRGRDRDDDRYERRGRGRDYDRDHRDRDHDDDRQGGLRGPHGLIHPPPGILLAPGTLQRMLAVRVPRLLGCMAQSPCHAGAQSVHVWMDRASKQR